MIVKRKWKTIKRKNKFGVVKMEEGNWKKHTTKKPDYLSYFLLIVAVVLLLFGIGYQNMILGFVGVMCFVLVALKVINKKLK